MRETNYLQIATSQFALLGWRSPWQNAYAERLIWSIRRKCSDHVIRFGERHLRQSARGPDPDYDNETRHTCRSRIRMSPISRAIQSVGLDIGPPSGPLADCITNMCGLNLRQAQGCGDWDSITSDGPPERARPKPCG